MKITKELIKKDYELTYLIPGDLLDADVSRLKKEIAELVAKYKGTVVKEDDWGRKNMAYNISQGGKTYKEAVYVHMILNFPVSSVQEFEKNITLHREVIRHLLVIADEVEKSVEE